MNLTTVNWVENGEKVDHAINKMVPPFYRIMVDSIYNANNHNYRALARIRQPFIISYVDTRTRTVPGGCAP